MGGLTRLGVASLASYLIAVLLPALDVLIPVLPSETAVIALGVSTSGSTDPRIAVAGLRSHRRGQRRDRGDPAAAVTQTSGECGPVARSYLAGTRWSVVSAGRRR
jgi:hypothetical protein